jgi:serine protease Do
MEATHPAFASFHRAGSKAKFIRRNIMQQTQRLVLRHVSGSKAERADEFPLADFREVTIGRDPSAGVRFDPRQDDLVGRMHARIAPDAADSGAFTITDLGSKNGTYVNKQRIAEVTHLAPGDVIQLGPGGPEMVFDLDPRPENVIPRTREVSAPLGWRGAPPPTREANPTAASPAPSANGNRPLGKATVERLVADGLARSRGESRNLLLVGGLALLALLALATGLVIYHNRGVADGLNARADEIKKNVLEDARKNQPPAGAAAPQWADITSRYNDAVVKIEAGWHLVHSQTKGVLYHQFLEVPGQKGKFLPAFVELIDGNEKTLEPYIWINAKDQRGRDNIPIGSNHSGSGFVVHPDGYILTNRHVAATWENQYVWPNDSRYQYGGVVIVLQKDPVKNQLITRDTRYLPPDEFPREWVPANTKLLGGKLIEGKIVEGEFEYLDVAFANDRLRRRARLILASDRHDVALIKVDVAGQALHAVELNRDDSVQKQDPVLVMGYPAITPRRREVTESAQGLNSEPGVASVSDPTATSGAIQNIHRDLRSSGQTILSDIGDAYQLQINTTGSGNSGGPVLDEKGRVIGIFFAGINTDGAAVTFAVPIRYGLELLGPKTAEAK